MLYLAIQFVWFLLAAFAIGLVMGWITCTGGKFRFWAGPIPYVAAAWAVIAALVWLQAVNGMPALWLETALLYVAAYLAGCCLACLIRTLRRSDATAAPAAGLHEPAMAPLPSQSVSSEGAVLGDTRPAAKVEGEDLIPGKRPLGFAAARGGTSDDLKLIKGIGRQNEGRLHGLGIWHFDQIAAWTPENVEWVGSYLAFPGRIERENWVAQAKSLAVGGETEFSARARAGRVASSRDDGTGGQGNVADMSESGFEGERPQNTLPAARDGKPDDLTLIKGIGPAIAASLNHLGLWHFDQIAALRDAEIRFASAYSGVPGRGISEKWREDADILANGGETAHSRAIKAGRSQTDG
jgi:predicted flap endonuclease-1-like 5' DNA nuclease